jgi:hypothetical protein
MRHSLSAMPLFISDGTVTFDEAKGFYKNEKRSFSGFKLNETMLN